MFNKTEDSLDTRIVADPYTLGYKLYVWDLDAGTVHISASMPLEEIHKRRGELVTEALDLLRPRK